MNLRAALLAGILLAVPALAGCADDPPAASRGSGAPETGGGGATGAPVQPTSDAPVRPRGTSERWHFHDYWKGSPTITLFEGVVTLNATPTGGEGVPSLSALVELPHGVIVPPETGFLSLNVSYDDPFGGVLNLTYRPADSNDFFLAGDLVKGTPLVVNTTASMCDVPHRQLSVWRFNLTAKPGGVPPSMPAREVLLNITATIGRPLFIDPPHLNWWRDGDTIPLVAAASGELRTLRTPVANATVPEPTSLVPPTPTVPSVPPSTLPSPGGPTADDLAQARRVPVDEGRIVPEGAKSVVAILNWTSNVPDAKLTLRYRENNYPTEGPMELLTDGAGSRVFVLAVAQAQTDTTYSNRTTWEFRVVPEGEDVAAFEGTFTLVAWASRLAPAAAAAEVTRA